MTTINQYTYLIGYVANGATFGRIDMTLPATILSTRDVQTVERMLREHLGTANVVVLSFSRYADDEVGGTR